MWERRIVLSASSSSSAAATAIWPGWPRTAWMRGSNGASLPAAASTLSAPATSAAAKARSAANSPAAASAVETWLPLSKASPSLAASTSGDRPSAWRTAAAGRRSPANRISPSPISAQDRCASGARSPEAPTEPLAGTVG